MLVYARAVSVCAIRSGKDACAIANEAEVAENVRTASMMARKSRGDIVICCGGGSAVEDEPAKSAGDGALEVIGAGGSDEAGSVRRGATGIETGEGETRTGGKAGIEAPSVGTAWEGCSTAGRSSVKSSSTSSRGWR